MQRIYVEPIAHLADRTESQVRRFVQDAFGVPENADVFLGHDDLHAADVSIATHWPTTKVVASDRRTLFKAYFIQDFEPEFYAADDPLYREAAMSYGLPLRHVCLGRHLALRLEGLTGLRPETVDFALDPIFRLGCAPEERLGPVRVLFFARPSLRRRGYDVGIEALSLVKRACPNIEIAFFGSSTAELGDVPFPFTNLGVLDAGDVASAMNDAHILLTFSLTNISNVPFEGMACGCAVVDVDLPNVSTMVEPGTCVLAPFDARGLSDAVIALAVDDQERIAIARAGARTAALRTWEHTGDMFEHALRQLCFVGPVSKLR